MKNAFEIPFPDASQIEEFESKLKRDRNRWSVEKIIDYYRCW